MSNTLALPDSKRFADNKIIHSLFRNYIGIYHYSGPSPKSPDAKQTKKFSEHGYQMVNREDGKPSHFYIFDPTDDPNNYFRLQIIWAFDTINRILKHYDLSVTFEFIDVDFWQFFYSEFLNKPAAESKRYKFVEGLRGFASQTRGLASYGYTINDVLAFEKVQLSKYRLNKR
ncbi:hypothetical protein MA9V1_196 [Chryseobacterium phage MA9V-1]|nr:hypothetical protein MA9V1_196 [Chryseobacterium phage MA9V-1]